MLGQLARYDAIAAWYLGWTEGWSAGFVTDPAVGLIPDRLDGERWLDVACGAGRTSRELARRGAEVVAVDVSGRLIEAAAVEENAQPLGIGYRRADITRPDEWWDGRAFDGAVCEMALMDIDDLEGTIATVALVLRSAGRFCISMVHPCCPRTEAGLSSWPPELGYQAEGSGRPRSTTLRECDSESVPIIGLWRPTTMSVSTPGYGSSGRMSRLLTCRCGSFWPSNASEYGGRSPPIPPLEKRVTPDVTPTGR